MLARTLSALFATHGYAWGTRELIASLVGDRVCNFFGSDAIGEAIEPLLRRAARHEGYGAAVAPRASDRHQYERAVGIGKEHVAPAAKKARGRDWRELERFCVDQSRHLAQAAARLRHTGCGIQVRGRIHGRRAADHRSEARPVHGKKTRARRDVASLDRPLSIRQFRAGFRRGGQQSSDALRPNGLSVLRDHAARAVGGTRLEARARVRALQSGRRYARARGGGVHRDARRVLYLGAPQRQEHSIRISGQQRASGPTSAHRRLRRQRHVQRTGRRETARHRSLRTCTSMPPRPNGSTRIASRSRPSTT